MKHRILFVDDEPNILKGLQRSLRPFRIYWDMEFAEGAVNALAMMEQQAFDVIVSDMQMPGMDGAALLKIVQEKFPMMARIILSGHSDQEMTMKSVKTAHQYLSKPCEKETLITAITRTLGLKTLLNKKPLQTLLGKIQTMPSMPALYARIMDAVKDPGISIADIGQIIEKDMGMTAKLLQLVNSSFFSIPRHIGSAREALDLLGLDVVKTLVLSIDVFSRSNYAISVIPVKKIHAHCLKTGDIALKIAGLEKMSREKSENAMMASFLHDLGKLLLAEYFPDDYTSAIRMQKENSIKIQDAEKEIFGVTHAEVGAYLLGLWGLPESIIAGIAYHHSPSVFVGKELEICGLIHIAELMAYHEELMPGRWDRLNGIDAAYVDSIGLSGKISLWRDYLRGNT